ncbi:glycosyltransferase [Spongorhabdus nitratireducens]
MSKNSEYLRKITTAHTCNIANVAYENCKILNQFGCQIELYCHDITHIMSQPEWDDLDLNSEDFPDENNFYSNSANLKDYKRPKWYHSGSLFNLLLNKENEIEQKLVNSKKEVTHKDSIKKSFFHHIAEKFIFKAIPYSRKLPTFMVRFLKHFYFNGFIFFSRQKIKTNTGFDYAIEVSKLYGKKWEIEKEDCKTYEFHVRWMKIATANADIVFAYVLSPIYMLLNHNKPYVAIEIGTMRDIPFEGSSRGKLLAQSYREADFVLITNPDVRSKALELGLKRYDFCPHPIDEDRYKPLTGQARDLAREKLFEVSGNTLVLFAPARQNWAVKGNDKYFRAIQKCKNNGMDVKLVIPGWGQEVKESKSYCKKLGIEDVVKWIKPVSEGGLIKYFSSTDIVLDQYELGVFGLITPKALSCGAVVVTSYDKSVNSWCFKDHPPILAASEDNDIFEHISSLYYDRQQLRELSRLSREWVKKEHSKERVKNTMARAAKQAEKNFKKRRILYETP